MVTGAETDDGTDGGTARLTVWLHGRVQGVGMRGAQGPAWTDGLREHGVIAIDGVDTRSLVLHLRDKGAMWAAIGTGDVVPEIVGGMEGQALVAAVSTGR